MLLFFSNFWICTRSLLWLLRGIVRMYLNITLNFFFYFNKYTRWKKKITEIIVKHGDFLLSKFWHEVNVNYFYEFFYLFDTVNSSICYENVVTKPKFDPYHGPRATLTIIRFWCHMTYTYKFLNFSCLIISLILLKDDY